MWSGAENENGILIVNIFRAKAFKNEAKIVLSNYVEDRKRKDTVKDIKGLQHTIYKTYRYTVSWRDYIQQTSICYAVEIKG
jgi:hypothetical protein